MVNKNGWGLFGFRALKSAVSQYLKNWLINWADFLYVDTNVGKLKVTLIILGGHGQKWVRPWRWWDSKIRKPSVSQKWFDKLSKLIEWFLHADSDGIIFYSTLYLWHQNAGGPLQFYLASFLVV